MKVKCKITWFTYLSLTLITLLVLVLPLMATRPTESTDASSYLVQGVDSAQVASLVENAGGTVTSYLPIIKGVGANLTSQQYSALSHTAGITKVTLNNGVTLADDGDNQGSKDKTQKGQGNFVPDTNYPDVVGADVVWDQGVTGEGVTVAIIDTGLERTDGLKMDINGSSGRIIGWVDFVEAKKNPQDKNGHGTHIAGIIANSEIGLDGEWDGVAPGVNLVGIRVLNREGFGTYEQVIQGIQWAVDHKDELNIRVINLSIVSQVFSPYWADPLNQAVMQAWANGIVVVACAGNGGPDPMSISVPGNVPYVITVGAFTDNYTPMNWNDDYITPFSAAGPTLDGFVKPDVVAPGAHIVSIMDEEDWLVKKYPETLVAKRYYAIAGTSQSTAVVSGIAALTLANNPSLTPDQVKYRLMYTASLWVDPVTTEALYSIWQQGAGRVDAPGAVLGDFETLSANVGMDIIADLDGSAHYEGYSYFDPGFGEFKLGGEYGDWAGGYGSWAGEYGSWAGGYSSWTGGYGSWAGGYGSWAGTYAVWVDGYGSWAGGYGSWAGDDSSWTGGYGSWAGGYGSWAGGYGSWAGGYGSWAGNEPWIGSLFATENFVTDFLAGKPPNINSSTATINIQIDQ